MIGNDIIDLSLAKIQSNWQRSRFLEKQFTWHEIDAIQKSANPFLLVWRFWSMKESAYKIAVQQQNKRFFAPMKFSCKIVSKTEGLVKFEDQIFTCITQITQKYIYTSAGESTFQYVGQIIGKQKMLQIIERKLRLSSTRLEIKKNAAGIPYLYAKDQVIFRSFTKTHHGEFEAFEYLRN